MDLSTLVALVLGSGVNILCWGIPVSKVRWGWRLSLILLSGSGVLYGLLVVGLMGTMAMTWKVPLWIVVVIAVIIGGTLGGVAARLAWKQVEFDTATHRLTSPQPSESSALGPAPVPASAPLPKRPGLDLSPDLEIVLPGLVAIPGNQLEGAKFEWLLLLRDVFVHSLSHEPLRLQITLVLATPGLEIGEFRIREDEIYFPETLKNKRLTNIDSPWLRSPLDVRPGQTKKGPLGFALYLPRSDEKGPWAATKEAIRSRIYQQQGHEDAHPNFPFSCSLEVVDQLSGRRLIKRVPGTKDGL